MVSRIDVVVMSSVSHINTNACACQSEVSICTLILIVDHEHAWHVLGLNLLLLFCCKGHLLSSKTQVHLRRIVLLVLILNHFDV